MKLAIVITGNYRTWDYCKPSFVKTFTKYNPDIFISTYDRRWETAPFWQQHFNDFEEQIITCDYILNNFQDLNIAHCNFELGNVLDNFDTSVFDSSFRSLHISFYAQVRKMLQAVNAIEQSEISYDLVVKTRFDLLYKDFDIDGDYTSTICIDNKNNYPNDWVLIGTADNVTKTIKSMYNEFYKQTNPASHQRPPHGLLASAVAQNNLTFSAQDLVDCLVRKNNYHHRY